MSLGAAITNYTVTGFAQKKISRYWKLCFYDSWLAKSPTWRN